MTNGLGANYQPSKIKTLMKILGTIVRDPKRLKQLLDENDDLKRYVAEKYPMYKLGFPTIDLLDLFPDFDETIDPYSFLDGGSLATDLALLKGLSKKYDVRRYFEIGTWRGESVCNVAQIAQECISMSFAEEEMRQSGQSEEYISAHEFFSKNLRNVRHIGHNSRSFNFTSHRGKYDLVFIDADHCYTSVKTDTANAFPLLRNSNSVIVWHDYGYNSTETVRWSVVAGILDGMPEHERGNLYHVSHTMCAVLLRGNFRTRFVKFPETPTVKFRVELCATKIAAGQVG
jgi:hypothetical protein